MHGIELTVLYPDRVRPVRMVCRSELRWEHAHHPWEAGLCVGRRDKHSRESSLYSFLTFFPSFVYLIYHAYMTYFLLEQWMENIQWYAREFLDSPRAQLATYMLTAWHIYWQRLQVKNLLDNRVINAESNVGLPDDVSKISICVHSKSPVRFSFAVAWSSVAHCTLHANQEAFRIVSVVRKRIEEWEEQQGKNVASAQWIITSRNWTDYGHQILIPSVWFRLAQPDAKVVKGWLKMSWVAARLWSQIQTVLRSGSKYRRTITESYFNDANFGASLRITLGKKEELLPLYPACCLHTLPRQGCEMGWSCLDMRHAAIRC